MASPGNFGPSLRSSGASGGSRSIGGSLRSGAKPADNSPLAQVLNFGQSVIDTVSTPLYGIQGFLNQLALENKKGNTNPVDVLGKSLEAGNKNATAWTTGQKRVTGTELLTNLGIIPDSKFGNVKIGNSEINLPGLAADIALDPLTYIPGGVFVTAAKAPVIAGRAAVKAGALAAKGEISASVALRKAVDETTKKIVGEAAAGQAIKFKPLKTKFTAGWTPERIDLAAATKRIAGETGQPLTKLEAKQIKAAETVSKIQPTELAYKTLQLGDSPLNTVSNQLASSLEAARSALVATVVTDNARRVLGKINRKEASLIRKGAESSIPASAAIGAARQVESVAVKPGEAALALEDGTVATVKPNTTFIDADGGAHVWDGKNVRSWTEGDAATNRAAADTYLSSLAVKPAKPIVVEGRPIVDMAPTSRILEQVTKIVSPSAEVKSTQKMLRKLDTIVKKAEGVSVGGDNIAYKIRQIVDSVDNEKLSFFANLRDDVKKSLMGALKGANGKNPFDFILRAIETNDRQSLSVANEILNISFTGANGKVATVRDVINNNVAWEKISIGARTEIINAINKLVFEGADAKKLAANKLSEIAALVPENIAKEIAKTGALNADKKYNTGALNKILDGLKSTAGAAKKKYETFDDIVAGLKAGDQIDTPSLQAILTALDPDGALVEQVNKVAAADLNEMLATTLTREGMQIVSDARRRLEILDAEKIFEANGLAMHEAISSYLTMRLSGEFPPAGNAVLESRQEAADTIIRLFEGNTSESKIIRRAITSMSTAIDSRMKFLVEDIANSAKASELITSFGDAAILSTTKAFEENSKAINYLQANQSFSTNLIGSILGLMRSDAALKATRMSEKGATAIEIAAAKTDQLPRFETLMSLSESLFLATLGTRQIVAKQVAQGGSKHFMYLHLGDVSEVVRKAGGSETMMRALFPNTATKTDSLSYIGMTDAVRMIVEGRSTGKMPTFEDVVARIMSRGTEQKPWSAEFLKTDPQKTAEELATYFLRKDVIETFEDIHKTRAVAEVEDLLGDVVTMTEDVVFYLAEAYKINKLSGDVSDAARRSLLREAFAKFSFAAGFMEQKSGEQAKSMMEIASLMFIKDGRMANIRELKEFIDDKILPEDAAELDAIMQQVDTMYQHEMPYKNAPVGLERIKAPTSANKAKALENLEGKKAAFETHITTELAKVQTPQQLKAWDTTYDRILKQLDDARVRAMRNHLDTQHWDGTRWVDSRFYNHAAALQKARNSAERFKLVGDTQVDMGARMADTVPVNPGTKLNAKESKALIKRWTDNANKRSVELADGASQDAAQRATDLYGTIEREAPDAFWAALRTEHERIAFKYSQVEEVVDITEDSIFGYSGTYEGMKFTRRSGMEPTSALRTALGRFNANTNAETVSVLRNAQAQGFKAKNKISVVTRMLGERLAKVDMKPFMDPLDDFKGDLLKQTAVLRNRAFSKAFNYGLRNEVPPAELGAEFVELSKDLGRLINGVKDQIRNLNMDPKIVDRYMRKYGVTDFEGFQKPSGYKNPEEFANGFINDLPFSENPYQAGDTKGTIFADNKAKYEAAGRDPFMMFSNIVFALVDAKTEQVFVNDFISQFGYKAAGISMKKALNDGRVAVKEMQGSLYDLSAHLTGKELDGALFEPEIAKQFANLNREWSYIQSKEMKPFLRYLMDFTGILKTTQTILRPGHVMTNVVGDTFNSFVLGARQYKHWGTAMRLAKQYMVGRVKEEGFAFMPGNIEAAMDTAAQGLARLGKNPEAALKEGQKATYTAVIGGKKQELDANFLLQLAEDTGTANDNIINTDIQGLYESIQARAIETGSRGQLAKSQYAKVKEAFDKGVKPAGDVTAYYSNIPRMASMLSIIDRKAWSSIDELKKAITDDIALYHPSIFSLTATERRYPRALFTYYTWLRVSHNALIDMALNHTAALTLYPKTQFSAAEQAGYEPVSLGNAWGVNKQMTPSYINYSLYAPTGEMGPRGPVLFKPSIMPMDVLDTWNWTYDPLKTWDQNVAGMVGQIGRVGGRSVNIVAAPAVEWLTGTDLNTGRKTQIDSLKTFGDEVLNNLGYAGLLKGIGAWTPENKKPENTSNPITDRDRQLYLQNWLLGLKRQDLQTISNQTNAATEQSARLKQFMEYYYKQQQETNK